MGTCTPEPRASMHPRTPCPVKDCCQVSGSRPPHTPTLEGYLPARLRPGPVPPSRDPGVPAEPPPAPGAAVPRLMTARPARAAAARSRSRAPGAGGGIAAARRGRGGGGRGARAWGRGGGEGGPRLRLHRPGGRRGRGEGAGGARRGGWSCCRPGEGGGADGQGDRPIRAGGGPRRRGLGGLLVGGRGLCYCGPAPPPTSPGPQASSWSPEPGPEMHFIQLPPAAGAKTLLPRAGSCPSSLRPKVHRLREILLP